MLLWAILIVIESLMLILIFVGLSYKFLRVIIWFISYEEVSDSGYGYGYG